MAATVPYQPSLAGAGPNRNTTSNHSDVVSEDLPQLPAPICLQWCNTRLIGGDKVAVNALGAKGLHGDADRLCDFGMVLYLDGPMESAQPC